MTLHQSAAKLDADALRAALSSAADVDCRCERHKTALYYAAAASKYRAPHDAAVSAAVVAAVERDGALCVRLLIDAGANPNAVKTNGWTPLMAAAKAGAEDVCVLLLNAGASIGAKNREESTALHIAARFGTPDVVRLLIERGADIDARTKQKRSPLHV